MENFDIDFEKFSLELALFNLKISCVQKPIGTEINTDINSHYGWKDQWLTRIEELVDDTPSRPFLLEDGYYLKFAKFASTKEESFYKVRDMWRNFPKNEIQR